MRFATCVGGWDASTIIAVFKLDGKYAVEGKDCHLYKDGSWEADSVETGVDLQEGIVLHKVPSVHFEPDAVWKAVIRGDRLVSNKPIEGEKNEKEASKKVLV